MLSLSYAARHATAEALSHDTFCEYCGWIARTHTSRGRSAGMLGQFSTAIVRIVGHFLSRHNLVNSQDNLEPHTTCDQSDLHKAILTIGKEAAQRKAAAHALIPPKSCRMAVSMLAGCSSKPYTNARSSLPWLRSHSTVGSSAAIFFAMSAAV